jgi:hypothetical protein
MMAAGSFDLKKMPPTPMTFAISGLSRTMPTAA